VSCSALLVLVDAYEFMENQIHWPGGVLSMFALAVGWALLVLTIRPAAGE
jgi:hypothetical protein